MGATVQGQLDGSVGKIDVATSAFVGRWGGGQAGAGSRRWSGVMTLRVPLSDATAANASALSLANPFGRTVMIVGAILNRTAGTTGTLDIGIDTDGTGSSDTIFDGAAATSTIFDIVSDHGTNGKTRQRWSATQYVTATPSVTPTSLVANLYLDLIDP
jgi:hypothetical protein